jgi:hypothetical protein
MCNLYSITKGQAAIGAFTRAMRDLTGNLPQMPGLRGADRSQRAGRSARADARSLGHAGTSAVRRRSDY